MGQGVLLARRSLLWSRELPACAGMTSADRAEAEAHRVADDAVGAHGRRTAQASKATLPEGPEELSHAH